jgi:hypothetical protein
MAPSASTKRRKKRGRGEEGSSQAALGAHDPQGTGAQRQRVNTHEPGTHRFFLLI